MAEHEQMPSLVRLGRVARPHGVRGAVAVTLDNPESDSLLGVAHVYLRRGEQVERRDLRRVQPGRKGQVVLSLEGVPSVEAAELLREQELLIEASQLPSLGEREFWQRDLLGLQVMDARGESLGRVVEVVDTADIPVLVVRGDAKERFVPFTKSHVREVDVSGGRILVDPPEELP